MRRSRLRAGVALIAGLAIAWASAGCRSAVTAPSNYAPFSFTDLKVGTGDPAAEGQLLLVNYTGWLYDATQPEQKGAVFDTSTGRSPFSFTLGFTEVIEGWDDGLVGIKLGGIRRLVIPPSKAYGEARHGGIPPSATLLFEVELLAIQ